MFTSIVLVMMLWCETFRQTWNPSMLHATTPGSYVQVVHSDYDLENNQTYFVIARFDIAPEGQEYVDFLQPRPLTGKPTVKQMLDSVEADPYIQKVQ